MAWMPHRPLQLKLFRREAVAATQHRWLGDVTVVTPPAAPVAAGCAILACVMLAVSTVAIRIPERVPAVGRLLPAKHIVRVEAPRAGIVSEVGIADGDAVNRGDPLLAIRAPGAESGESPLVATQRSLERELEVLAAEETTDASAVSAAQANMQRRTALARERIDAAASEALLLEEREALALRQLARARRVASAGGLAEHQIDALQADALAAGLERNAALQRRSALRQELESLDGEHRQRQAELEHRRLRRALEHERLQRDLLAQSDELERMVTAPADGVVAGLLVTEGEAVRAGQMLLQLYEPGGELQAYLYISADSALRVRRGDVLELRLRAYPYPLYGTWSATVTAVSAVPAPAENLVPAAGLPGELYELRAALDRDSPLADLPLPGPGATFDAELVHARWPLYRWVLRRAGPAA